MSTIIIIGTIPPPSPSSSGSSSLAEEANHQTLPGQPMRALRFDDLDAAIDYMKGLKGS